MGRKFYDAKTFRNGQELQNTVEFEQFKMRKDKERAMLDKLPEKERKAWEEENWIGDPESGQEGSESDQKRWADEERQGIAERKKEIVDGLEINKDYTGLRKTGLKKGGKVKAPKKFSRGGGIEVRGKTKGRFV
jgi:hypothetical protein